MATYTALVDVQVNTRQVNKAFKNIEGSLLSINKRTARTNQFFQRLEASFGRVEKQLGALNRQTTNSIRAMRSMKQAGGASSKEIEKLKKQVADLNKQLKQSKSGFTIFGNLFKSLNKVYKENAYLIQSITAGLFAFVQYNLIGGIKRLSDQFILMQSRLRVVNDSQDVFNKNLLQSFEIAQKTRQPLFQVANTLARIGRNSSVLQKDFAKLGRITETIGKSFQVAGATIEEANNAMIQLSQAFASGRLQGDELRSVLELAPRLAQGIAKQIGISVGSLRAFAKEGRLTTEVLRLAIEGASQAVDRDFKKVQQTIGQAVTNVNSTLLMLVGTTNMVTGTNQKFVNAVERINKALQGLAGDDALIFIADSLGFIADNLEMVIKVATSFIATGVAAAFLMALKAVVASLGIMLIPLAAVTTGMYFFMDSMIDTKREAGQTFKKILEEAKGPLTETEKEIRNVENSLGDLKKMLKEGEKEAQKGDWKWMYDLLEVFQKIDDSAKSFFERLLKDGKGTRMTAKFVDPPELDPKTEAGREKIQKEKERHEKTLAGLARKRRLEEKEVAKIKKAEEEAAEAAEREAELKFLETYEVQLQAAKKLNAERLKGVDAELAFVTKYDNFTDVFGAQKYQQELKVATSARKEFAKILQGFNEAPGTFGEIIKNGRVNKDALLNALETEKLEERFQKEPALREALKKDALRITDNLNTELIEAEKRRLAEQAQIYNAHLHAMAEQRRSTDLGIAFADYGDPNQLGGQELASYERMRDLEAGAEKVKQLKDRGIFDEKALELARKQGEELNEQLRTLRQIVDLNQIRAQTESANVSYIKKQADLDLDRSVITGKLTKEGQEQKILNESVLAVQDELNIKSKHMKVLKDGAIDIDLKAAKLSKKEIEKLGEIIKREEKKQEVKRLGIATGEMDDAASQQAVQNTAVKGVMGAGGQSAQRAQQTMVAYQAAGGGMMGMINAITSLVLSNKKVMEAITTIFDAVMEPIDAILDPVGELISTMMLLMKPFTIFNKLIGKMLGGMIKSLTQIIHPLSSMMEALQPVLVMIGVFVQIAVQFISALVGGIADVVEFFVNAMIGPQDPGYKPETLLQEEANILDEIQTSLEGAADALDKINDVVFEITNSALNLLAPSIKLEDAKDKYDELFALAKNIGDDESIDEFTSYARDYLQQSQDVLKSSSAYQGIYDSVISDLGTLQKNIQETVSDDLTKELKGAVFNLDLVGSDLGDSIRDMVKYFQRGAVDYVDIMTYIAYKSTQVATDLELKQMAEFGQIDSSEYERIRQARGAASSSSSLSEDLSKLQIVLTNPEHIAVGLSRTSGGGLSVDAVGEDDSALAMVAAAHASGIPVVQDPPTARFLAGGGSPTDLSSISSGSSVSFSDYSVPTIGELGESQSFKIKDPFEMFGGGGFDLFEMFSQLGQLIIDGLIAALEAIGATAEAILKAIFGFIQTALDQASDLVGQILSFIMGPIKDALDSAANVAMSVLGSILAPISEALYAFPDIATGVLNAILVPLRDALYGIQNLGGQVLSAIFGGISNLQVSAGQFLTGIFMPILNLIGKIDVNQFFSALIYPIMKALSGSFSGVGDLFQKMVIDPIMNAIGMNNLPDLMNIAQQAVDAVKRVIGVDVTGIFGWDINEFFDDIQEKLAQTFTADFSKIFGGWDLGKFIEDTMEELNDLFSIDVPSGHIKLLPNPFKGNFGGPSHFIDFKFAEGGDVNMPGGLAQGPSHDRGGIKAVVAPRTANAGLIEFEGGEYIIKKSTVDMLGSGLLDAINNKPEFFMGGQHFYPHPLPNAVPFGHSVPPQPGARTTEPELPIEGGYRYAMGGLSPNGFPSQDYGDLGVIGGKDTPQFGNFGAGMPGFPLKMIDLSESTDDWPLVRDIIKAAGLGGPYGFDVSWTADSIQDHSGRFAIGRLEDGGMVNKFQNGGMTHAQTGIFGGDRGAGAFNNAMGFMQSGLPMDSLKGNKSLVNANMPPPFWGCELEYQGMHCVTSIGPCYEVWEMKCHGAKGGASISYDIMKPHLGLDTYYDKASNGGLVTGGNMPKMGSMPKMSFRSGGLVGGGGFKSRCNACGSNGRSASYGSAVGYASGGIVSFQDGGNSFGYNPLTYGQMGERGIQYTSSEITNETISLFDPLLFEGFSGLESYETGFQDVGNQLIDQFKLAYNQGIETNRLLGLLIDALYSEIGRLERTIIEYLETLPEVVKTMDRNITAAINRMNVELQEEIYLMGQGIEEEIRKIAPSFGLLIIEIQAAFVQAILDAGLDKIFEESLKNMEISIPKAVVEGVEGAFDKLITGESSVEEQTRRALESVFDNSGGGIKVITESMGDPWYDDMEEIFDSFLDKITKRIAVGGLIAAVAAFVGGTAAIVAAAAGVIAAFSDEIGAAFAGSDLETGINKFVDAIYVGAEKIEKEIANLGVIFSDKNISKNIREGAYNLTIGIQENLLKLEKFLGTAFGGIYEDSLHYIHTFRDVVINFIEAPGKFFESILEIFSGSDLAAAIRFLGEGIMEIVGFFTNPIFDAIKNLTIPDIKITDDQIQFIGNLILFITGIGPFFYALGRIFGAETLPELEVKIKEAGEQFKQNLIDGFNFLKDYDIDLDLPTSDEIGEGLNKIVKFLKSLGDLDIDLDLPTDKEISQGITDFIEHIKGFDIDIGLPNLDDIDIDLGRDIQNGINDLRNNLIKAFDFGSAFFGDEVDWSQFFRMDDISINNPFEDVDFGFKMDNPFEDIKFEFPEISPGEFISALTAGLPSIDMETFLFGNSPTGLLGPVADLVGQVKPVDWIKGVIEGPLKGIKINPSDLVDTIMGFLPKASMGDFDISDILNLGGVLEGADFSGLDITKPIKSIIDQFVDDITNMGGFEFDIMEFGKHLEETIAAILDIMFGWINTSLPDELGEAGTGLANNIKANVNAVAEAFSGLQKQFFNAIGLPEGLDLGDLSMGVVVDIFGATGSINAGAKNLIEIMVLPGLLSGRAFSVDGPTGIFTKSVGDLGNVVGSQAKEMETMAKQNKYEEGGVLKGPSHSQGGIKAIVGGKRPIEMEGGEYVINKDTVSALGVPFFDFLNAQKKTDVDGQPTKYNRGALIPDMDQATKNIFSFSAATTGDVRRVLGHHGIEGGLGFDEAIPYGNFSIFAGGGMARETGLDGSRRVHEAINIRGSNFLGEAGFRAGVTQEGLGMMPFADPYIRLKNWKDWSLFDKGGPVSQDYTDPELRNLMQELIATIKDKDMGVNIYNETGQNLQVGDGEGEGFNESDYRESSNLA